jgi:hypothetical protein
MSTKIEWTAIIQQWEASGLSKQAFCKRESIAYHVFLYHFKRNSTTSEVGSFQQVMIDADNSSDKIDFFWQDGRSIRFPISTPKEIIRFILSL